MAIVQDISLKRIRVAKEAQDACTKFVDALNQLLQLKEERAVFGKDFADTDFKAATNMHLTPDIIGTLFDFVVPSITKTYLEADEGRNKQILLQMRG